MKKKILLTQVCIGDYRDKFIDVLTSKYDVRIQVGEYYFEDTTKLSSNLINNKNVIVVKNRFFLSRRLCWQNLIWKEVISADTVVGELNPRILSTWFILILRIILGKRTYLWGHAWSRGGKDSKTEKLRHLMRKLASGLLFYTQKQKAEFIEKYPVYNKKLSVAPNSVFFEREMRPLEHGKDFIYVGRLVKNKKVDILIKAFIEFFNSDSNTLHIVGSGDQLEYLKLLSENLQPKKRILFHGHISDTNKLSNIYSGCAASISPGYVGLAITQSLSFGIPMIVSKNELHSPEIEALVEDFNGSFFKTDDLESLASQMIYWINTSSNNFNLAENIVIDCKKRYSVEKMVSGFMELVDD